ncbi:hypothetical protein IMZ48_06805 [Candidatus Bathyarchaeota archaeon]|nr:hypothetical protein [Candidatus Bathyarchaeota archaeon]
MASTMYKCSMLKGKAPPDILQLSSDDASSMLHGHFTKRPFNVAQDDNLMSWSSSLLFVIQNAIWRSRIGKIAPSDVTICAVDTTKFPLGQFVRDMWLIKTYRDDTPCKDQRDFFDFRLKRSDYDNGEYLSQGLVNHGGRSCTFSLQDLINAGLHDLYPEFAEDGGKEEWANRVKKLRDTRWYYEEGTSQDEVRHALEMARGCFGRFSTTDMTMVLLAFKNRKLREMGKSSYPGKSVMQRLTKDFPQHRRRTRSRLKDRGRWRPVGTASWRQCWKGVIQNSGGGRWTHSKRGWIPNGSSRLGRFWRYLLRRDCSRLCSFIDTFHLLVGIFIP